MTFPLPGFNLALLNKTLCKHRYLLPLVHPHTLTHTHKEPTGPRPRAEQTVHFMNINTKCTGPPAVHDTKAIYKGKDQKHSYHGVPDYTHSKPNEATPHYLPSIPPKHPLEPPTRRQHAALSPLKENHPVIQSK